MAGRERKQRHGGDKGDQEFDGFSDMDAGDLGDTLGDIDSVLDDTEQLLEVNDEQWDECRC
jgi:hypothetical protein